MNYWDGCIKVCTKFNHYRSKASSKEPGFLVLCRQFLYFIILLYFSWSKLLKFFPGRWHRASRGDCPLRPLLQHGTVLLCRLQGHGRGVHLWRVCREVGRESKEKGRRWSIQGILWISYLEGKSWWLDSSSSFPKWRRVPWFCHSTCIVISIPFFKGATKDCQKCNVKFYFCERKNCLGFFHPNIFAFRMVRWL